MPTGEAARSARPTMSPIRRGRRPHWAWMPCEAWRTATASPWPWSIPASTQAIRIWPAQPYFPASISSGTARRTAAPTITATAPWWRASSPPGRSRGPHWSASHPKQRSSPCAYTIRSATSQAIRKADPARRCLPRASATRPTMARRSSMCRKAPSPRMTGCGQRLPMHRARPASSSRAPGTAIPRRPRRTAPATLPLGPTCWAWPRRIHRSMRPRIRSAARRWTYSPPAWLSRRPFPVVSIACSHPMPRRRAMPRPLPVRRWLWWRNGIPMRPHLSGCSA